MKDRKRRFETFSFYDRTGIEAHLKKMAEKGWMISEMTTLGWIYKRVEPESLTFAVSYYPKASEFDPEPTEGQNIYHDLSSRTGWQFVCSSAQMQVFCTTDDKPIPIETDPALEVEMIHRSAKKGFLLSYYILLAVGVLNGALFISRLLGDPIGVLASPTNLFTGVAWTMLMLLCGVELIGYYRWRSKALKAADRGEFVDTPNHAQFQKLVLAVVFIALFYWLINVVAVGDTLMKWVSILNYCFRCMPQVQGVCRENLDYVKHLVEVEINAATDNPLIFPKGDGHYEFLSGGNFHGEPTGFAMDILTMSLVEIGNVADRRCFTLCDPTISYGLPLALAGEPIGLNYGYNIICCSTSALASENKTLAFPSVCDNIPTKANQEDHVSMAPWAARKTKLVIKNLEKILGIELLLASRGIWITQDELGQFKLGKGTSIAYEKVNELIKFQKEDIYMGNQSKATINLIESDELLNAVESAVGEL